MDEKPAQAMRRGKGSSLWNAIEAVKSGEAARRRLGRQHRRPDGHLQADPAHVAPDLERPAIVASWPTLRGVTAVLDVGANIESDAEQLVEFAIMGEAFHRAVHGTAQPDRRPAQRRLRGHEGPRGGARGRTRILRDGGLDLDYRGFVEGDDIAKGTVDVVVTDGFTGNIALKTAEGVARFISALLKEALTSSLHGQAGRPDRHAGA